LGNPCQPARWPALAVAALLVGSAALPSARAADPPDTTESLPAVVVTGRASAPVTEAASQGIVTARSLAARPLMRAADVLESVPGLVVTQHSGDGKANQYFLRGFNLDHGTDFATWVAGMPVNQPTHAHGQGYTDLNFLIPELIERIDYRKGPYRAEDGDFASAGSARISLRDEIAQPFAQIGLGAWGHRRALLAGSGSLQPEARLLGALELQRDDGPWENPQGLRRANGLLSWSQGHAERGVRVTGMSYQSRWNATDQVPQRAIDAGLIGRFGAIDPSDGGDAQRHSLSAQWWRNDEAGSLQGSVYLIRSRLNLYSNFTYALDDPVNGDQFLQRDERLTAGGQLARAWSAPLAGLPARHTVGVQWREDRIRVGLFDTLLRETTGTVRDDRVRQSMLGVHAESRVEWLPWLRTTAGLRADRADWRVDASVPQNSGHTAAARVSPRFSAAAGPWAGTEFFAHWGRGFHSNDGRGVTMRVDPLTGAPVSAVTGLVPTTGREIGLRAQWLPGWRTTLALWQLRIGSELVFVGDAGITEPSRPSTREGVEWGHRWQPRPWLVLEADLAWSRARFDADGDAGTRVPGSVSRVGSASVSVRELGPWSASLQWRHIGPRPLTEDGSQRAAGFSLVNTRLSWRMDRRCEWVVDGFNLANRRANDIEYQYVSRLRGEVAGVDDRHIHPMAPRTWRLGLRVML
jgi:hypothetical protein